MMLLEEFAKLMNSEMVLIDMQDKNLGVLLTHRVVMRIN